MKLKCLKWDGISEKCQTKCHVLFEGLWGENIDLPKGQPLKKVGNNNEEACYVAMYNIETHFISLLHFLRNLPPA